MSQHDTLTLREALRSIQYEATSLADAQAIALQALNATYPARAALSATQPAQASQGEPVVPPELDVRRIMLDIVPGDGDGLEVYAETVDDVVAKLTEMGERIEDLEGAQTAAVAQGAGEVVAPNDHDGLVAASVVGLASALHRIKAGNLEGATEVVTRVRNGLVAHGYMLTCTQPAAGADVLDAKRYRRLRDTNIQWVHKRAWISFEAQKEPGLSDIFETSEARNLIDAAIDAAIAASGRQS